MTQITRHFFFFFLNKFSGRLRRPRALRLLPFGPRFRAPRLEAGKTVLAKRDFLPGERVNLQTASSIGTVRFSAAVHWSPTDSFSNGFAYSCAVFPAFAGALAAPRATWELRYGEHPTTIATSTSAGNAGFCAIELTKRSLTLGLGGPMRLFRSPSGISFGSPLETYFRSVDPG